MHRLDASPQGRTVHKAFVAVWVLALLALAGATFVVHLEESQTRRRLAEEVAAMVGEAGVVQPALRRAVQVDVARMAVLERRLLAFGGAFGLLALLFGAYGLAQLRMATRAERRRADAEIAGQRSLLRTLIDHLPESIYVKDAQGRFLLANRFVARVMGVDDPDGLIGKTDFDFYPRHEAQQYFDDEQAVLHSGAALLQQEEPVVNQSTGEPRWFLTSKVPVRDEHGVPTSLVGMGQDITERKHAEQQLAEQRTLLRTLVDHLPEYIFVKDRQSRFLLANTYTAQVMGVEDPAVLIGKTDLDFYPKEVGEAFFRDEQEIIRTGRPMIGREEQAVDQSTGERRWLLTTKLPMRNVDGEVAGIVGMAQDITERKRAEQELIAAKDEAEAATRAKSDFLANMSHEIRTPMNGVVGMTSLLLDTPLGAEQREFVETIRTSGEQLLTIINDILDFSKIEAGHLALEAQPFDVRRCIEEALDLVAPRAAEKGLELAYLVEDGVPGSLIGDVTRVRQVLVNLLSNAVKFTTKGDVLVTVRNRSLARTPEGGARCELLFAVQDTGIGISEAHMDRLFRSFSQVDASMTRRFGGTGLGLAISKRLTELMGGTIWAESAEGTGSTFFFTIEAPVAPSQVRVFLSSEQPLLNGRRVLIIDDNTVNRQILRRVTEQWNMVVDVAESGAAAIGRFDEGLRYDVVLLDFQMPEMDGLSVARAIGARAVQLPVMVMLTSINQEARLRQAAREAGIAAVLYKPLKPAQLYEALLEAFRDEKTKRFCRTPAAPASTTAASATGTACRILLAEDNLVNQKVAIRFLERLGYRCDVVANGLEVLEALRRQPYHVVLMDVMMPEMDGLEATRVVRRELPEARQPRIVAMTANAMQGDAQRCLDAGMDDYLPKPVKLEDLREILARYQPVPA